jgi:hypothetical protein
VDVTLPLTSMDLEEELPILRLVIAGLYMALILLVPAVVEAARRGGRTVWMYFAVNRVAPFREGEPPDEPFDRFGWDGASPSPNHEESVNRGFPG